MNSCSISGSPNAYLAELALPGIERRTGVKFEYVPVLLGGIFKATGNMSPFESLRGIKNKPEYQALETQRFIRRHNATKFRSNPFFPVNTLMLMRGAVAAQLEGVFEPYFRAAYHHMWEEPKKMDDLETFRAAFISSGVDIDRLLARAQQDDVKKGLIDRTTDAVNRGAFGSPTFLTSLEMRCSSARTSSAMWRSRSSSRLASPFRRRPKARTWSLAEPSRRPRACMTKAQSAL
ncbi:2-hydroxychromene-2-carboxylate isomerase [Bradyrhizobium sp. LM6.11]